MGLLLRNLPPPLNVVDAIDTTWSASIRKIALTVILIRAGVGLDADVRIIILPLKTLLQLILFRR